MNEPVNSPQVLKMHPEMGYKARELSGCGS